MKKYYAQPFCEVFLFDSEDVLTNSDPFYDPANGETPLDGTHGSTGDSAGTYIDYAGKAAYGHKFYDPEADE